MYNIVLKNKLSSPKGKNGSNEIIVSIKAVVEILDDEWKALGCRMEKLSDSELTDRASLSLGGQACINRVAGCRGLPRGRNNTAS